MISKTKALNVAISTHPLTEMFSSKHHMLPDLDTGKDVYETPDIDSPTTQPTYNFYDDPPSTNPDVINSSLPTSEATKKFTNSISNTTKQELINKRNRKIPFPRVLPEESEYSTHTGKFRATGSSLEEETIIEKYRRLVQEVQELAVELKPKFENQVDDELFVDSKSGEVVVKNDVLNKDLDPKKLVSHSWLVQQVANLQSELEGLGQVAGAGIGLVNSSSIDAAKSVQQIATYKKLMDNINTTKQKSVSGKSTAMASVGGQNDSAVTYELFFTPEVSKQAELARIGELELRINALEKVVGTHYVDDLQYADSTVSEIVQTSGNLVTAIANLDHYLSILTEPFKMDLLNAKVKTLTAQLEKLAELRKRHTDATLSSATGSGSAIDFTRQGGTSDIDMQAIQSETERRVEYLFMMLEKLDPVASSIPMLITRLKALRQVHSEAAVFADTLNQLKEDQAKLERNSQQLVKAVSGMEKSFSENKDIILKNVTSLEGRMTDLFSRIENLK
ncbi:hypothetical protein HK098_001547 [Nowakowskiella sp. JEL0407]|nr:hypothetical protein HK098_001547 [Nowakowskiella sp. JEL0407]